MSRRTLTLAVAGFLVVLLSAIAALLPVPYVALEAGPVTDTLGSVGKTQLIRIDGRETYPVSGNLDLTTVHVLGGPGSQLGLVTALRGWLDDGIAIVPEDTVYPPGETAEEAEKESAAEMRDSQENATTAALRELGIPVEITSFVQDVPEGSPSSGKLETGDELVAIDGTPVAGGTQLRELITAHDPGDEVRVTVRRDGEERTETVTTERAEDGRAIVGITTRDEADYPFTVDISLEDVGGPSAGLMFALGIVDKLTPGSLTDGAHIAGTGTIDDTGHVGAIGGITQKMLGAERAGATVFLAPAGNCDEAKETVPDGLRLVKARTLSSAVSSLEQLAEGRTQGLPRC
ncbi:MAG TPA: PDZ domain-containing protein [Actinomycetes bacterium]|nr:PDZ domain-containing protein [Actinomycetes bacterium]